MVPIGILIETIRIVGLLV